MINIKRRSDEEFEKGEYELKRFRLPFLTNKYEDACEHFLSAGNLYKIDKEWEKVVSSYIKVSECMREVKDLYHCAEALVNASTYSLKYDIREAINYLEMAIQCYIDDSLIDIAGSTYKKLALLYEQNGDYIKTIECYEKYFDYCNRSDISDKTKVGDLYIQLGKYIEASKIYENLADTMGLNRMLQFSVTENLFKVCLCCLCLDDCVTLERNLEKYSLIHQRFKSESCYLLLQQLLSAYKSSDIDEFVSAIYEYERKATLDTLKINMLLKAKNNIIVQENNEDELLY